MKTQLEDYELAAQELDALFAAQKFSPTVVSAGVLTTSPEGWEHFAYIVRIKDTKFRWMQGRGVKENPHPARVLACTCADGVASETTFDDWCADFGYSNDSRAAERIYLACQKCLVDALHVLKSRALVEQFASLSNRL